MKNCYFLCFFDKFLPFLFVYEKKLVEFFSCVFVGLNLSCVFCGRDFWIFYEFKG